MSSLCRQHRRRLLSRLPIMLATLILLLSATATDSLPHFDSFRREGPRQELLDQRTNKRETVWSETDQMRRVLRWLGSSPPTCRSKCGRCFPCRPVRVTIQPGLNMPLEYYPEAWRCKCGNKLFMP